LAGRAEAALQAVRARRQQANVIAPRAGIVTAIVVREGEIVAPGAAIVQLARLDEVTLTVYMPEPDMGRVAVGQPAAVWVDSFPDRRFEGTITRVAERAEFTPKNVQTREERADTVFPVKITLPNPEGLLKPGMPADARLGEANGPAPGEPAGLWLFGARWALPTPEPLTAARFAGAIEATEVAIASEMSGRVTRVAVAEGEQVHAGQVVVELDAGEWQARRDEAEAAVAAARAELARVLAAPQPERVDQAEAQVAQARAGLAAAQTALAHARSARTKPQELDAQINATRSQITAAAAQVEVANAQLKAARVLQESIPPNTGSDQDRTRRAIYDQNVAAAEALVHAAQATQQGAQAALAVLLQIRQQPIALDAAVHRAEGNVAQAEAAVAVAEAALAQIKAPPQAEAVAVARARVAQAEAGLAAANSALEKLVVRSPADGVITVRAIHEGEVATAGTPLLTVTDLRQAKLVIYVPANQIGQVRIGQAAAVTVDAYPGRTFAATVVRIADQAEFTPKNVQTPEERVRTVFAVELRLEDEQGLLRPGMPAEAMLEGHSR
ncbi:MAG: HlyD family secretion protein, partial [Anaerolineae bacterium]